MVLFLGVCKALRAMHMYKVGEGSKRRAGKIRQEAEESDHQLGVREAAGSSRLQGGDMDEDEEQQEPLMEGEVAISQEGIAPGGDRAYAHRDIKPGTMLRPTPSFATGN